jgi:lipopolysaccharide/colanic/teichoic acid biosynthesis glycosyltransferase/GGDEF domain-containing protein
MGSIDQWIEAQAKNPQLHIKIKNINFCSLLALKQKLYLEKRRAERTGYSFSLILIDCEGINQLNGKFNNASKRIEVLEILLQQIAVNIRETDVLSFNQDYKIIILLPDTPYQFAQNTVTRLLTTLKSNDELHEVLTLIIAPHKISILSYPDQPDGKIQNETVSNRTNSSLNINSFFLSLMPEKAGDLLALNDQIPNTKSNKEELVLRTIHHFARNHNDELIKKNEIITKRIIDIVGATLGIILTSPIFLLIALIIKLTSRGSVFFVQERVGYRGKIFRMFKFRSMQVNASEKVHQDYIKTLLTDDAKNTNSSNHVAAYKDQIEQRITPIGKFLRKVSLDELPQLFNVLIGNMSLVGPRPHPPYEVALYKNWNYRRLLAKPGLTGFSKIKVRCTPENYSEAMRYDIRYVDHFSLLQDMRIILKTAFLMFSNNGAY